MELLLAECPGAEQPAEHDLRPKSRDRDLGLGSLRGQERVVVLSGPTCDSKSEGSGAREQMPGRPTSPEGPWPLSMPSRRPLAQPWGLCHPESSRTHLDWVLPRLWQPVFGKLGEGGLGRG